MESFVNQLSAAEGLPFRYRHCFYSKSMQNTETLQNKFLVHAVPIKLTFLHQHSDKNTILQRDKSKFP